MFTFEMAIAYFYFSYERFCSERSRPRLRKSLRLPITVYCASPKPVLIGTKEVDGLIDLGLLGLNKRVPKSARLTSRMNKGGTCGTV